MKHEFKKQSALVIADKNFVTAVGEAIVVFAAIEGAVNYALNLMIKNHPDWTRIAGASITQRLDLFSELVLQSCVLDRKEVEAIVARAKKVFRSRHIIAHNPLVTSGDKPGPRILKFGAGVKKELFAADISQIAREADDVYNDIWQVFHNYEISHFDGRARSGGIPPQPTTPGSGVGQ